MACNCGSKRRLTGFGTVNVNMKSKTTPPRPHILHLPNGDTEWYASSIEAHAARLSGKGGTVRPE